MKNKIKLLFTILLTFAISTSAWLYFKPSPCPYTCIPVKFLINRTDPIVEVQIENNPYLLVLDLGARGVIHLRKNALDKITKEQIGEEAWFDIRGNEYLSPFFRLPIAEMPGCRLRNVTCSEEDEYFVNEGSVIFKTDIGNRASERHLVSGRLGQDLFMEADSFFDFPKKQFFLVKNRKQFEKDFYSTKDYIEVSYEICSVGMVVHATTPHGTARLLVDTGCSGTLLAASFLKDFLTTKVSDGDKVYYDTSSFEMGGYDFGRQEMVLLGFELPLPIRDKVDGMLGMDFLESHRFYIDIHNRKIFFEKEVSALEAYTSDEKAE